jgi:shikimate kinase
LKTSSATTGSAVSIVNAIGTGGFGGAIGIKIPCTVKATLARKEKTRSENLILKTATRDKHSLISNCVRHVEGYLSLRIPKEFAITIEIDSRIPVAVGLKSSSAVSTAVVSALMKLLSENTVSPKTVLELSCKASKISRASITGAYDDAVACLLGGLALTDNLRLRAIKHTRVPRKMGTIVLLGIPRFSRVYTSSIKRSFYSKFKKNGADAFALAWKGNYLGASLMNSLIQCSALDYSVEPITSAIIEGASCAGISGKGPSVFAMCNTMRTADRIESTWAEDSKRFRIIRTTVVQPKEKKLL